MIKKILFGIIFVIVFLILIAGGAVLTVNFWLPSAMAFGIHQVTGFPTAIQKANLDLAGSKFGVYGIEIKNPGGFPKGNFVSIPEIYVDFDFQAFLKNQRIHIRELRLNVAEVGIVKKSNGESNISRLSSVNKGTAEASKQKEKVEKAKSPQELRFFVDTLILTIRLVRFQDQTSSLVGERNIDLRIDQEVVHGLSSPADIVRLVVVRIIYKAALGNLGVPVDFLKGQLDASLAKGQQLALQSTALAEHFGTQAFDEGEHLLKQASQQLPVSNVGVDKAVSETRAKAKSLFGGASHLLKNTAESFEEKAKSTTSSN